VILDLALASRRETTQLGERIARSLRGADLVLLVGALGSGKTFLARAIARGLGLPARASFTSPTFSLVHEYLIDKGELLHADLYRLLDSRVPLDSEIERLGLRERRAQGAIVVVEWGETGQRALGGAPAFVVTLRITGSGARHATVEGARAREVELGSDR
jgi:tRNA threonylcarbamoyladenosine biosynthesis protein TsaE